MILGILKMWSLSILAIGLWVGVFFLGREFDRRLPDPRPAEARTPQETSTGSPQITIPAASPPASFRDRLAAWRPDFDATTAVLAGLVSLAALGGGGGRWLLHLLLPKGRDEPRHERFGETRRIRRPDGTELHVEIAGRPDGPTVVLTHGWGTTATEWFYLRRQLAANYRVVAWDLPGLGQSTSPTNRDFSLEKLADDLKAVLDGTGTTRAVLIGHSIGGMTTLTFAKRHADELGNRIAGLVLVHTTPVNPLRTMKHAALMTWLQKPVLEPLCRLAIPAAPLIWLSSALGYLNGSQHWSLYRSVFSGSGTWGQVDFVARYVLRLWPATYARGVLGMFGYDATGILGRIRVPTLVVAADRDQQTKPEASEAIRAGVPGAELSTLSPAGHMGLLSNHEAFGAMVEGFLVRCFAAPARRLEASVEAVPVGISARD